MIVFDVCITDVINLIVITAIMKTTNQIQRRNAYLIAAGIFAAVMVSIGGVMAASAQVANPAQTPSAANTQILSPSGHCYSFENDCQNYVKHQPDSSFYTTGQALDWASSP
ncbi:MAG TPA: hypothetical protein VGR54_08890 [Nitrosopumilaceae archaeon]|nr:hypothetical protein [Nitrosopumilaceae archaeon]